MAKVKIIYGGKPGSGRVELEDGTKLDGVVAVAIELTPGRATAQITIRAPILKVLAEAEVRQAVTEELPPGILIPVLPNEMLDQ